MNILASTSFIGTTGFANHAKSFLTSLDKLTPIKVRNSTIGDSWKGYSLTPHNKEPYITNQMKDMLVLQTLRSDNGRIDKPLYNHDPNFSSDIDIVLAEHDNHYFYNDYNGYKIAYNVWETDKYDSKFFDQLKTFNELWVPSEWQKQISIDQGYSEDKIFVIPEGVNSKFKPGNKPEGKFKVLIVGRWEHRKGTKESIKAFLNAFPNNDNVELILCVDNWVNQDNLDSTENRLKHYGLEDPRITIKSFLSEKEYIKLLQECHVFLSASKSEGWNLPLIEAIACGTPSIYSKCSGQLEYTEGKGLAVNILGKEKAPEYPGNYYTVDEDHLVEQLKEVYNNYNSWKEYYLLFSKIIRKEFSWKKAAKKAYDRIQQIKEENKPVLNVHFVKEPYVKIIGGIGEYKIEFINKSGNQTIFTTNLKANHWAKTYHGYFIDWRILIKDKNDNIIDQHDYNAEGKRVFISLGSKSLGDTLAWFPVVEEFRKKHNCEVIVSTFHNDWFEKNYPQLEFVAPGTVVENIYAMYQIGWWYKGETDKVDYFKHSIDFRTLPLQKTASNILGVEHKEIIPKVTFKKGKRPIKEKYICFSPHASASAKYWHNIYGWQTVVDYLNEQGYKVVQISKEKYNSSFETTKLPGNKQIKNVIDATGLSMEDTVNYLSHCELYMGVSSGLAWLSWSVHTPVVMISGFSSEWTEFTTNVKRVINKDVCNSCFNNYRLDAGDWNWCPAHKDTPRHFECTRKISPESVIECIVDYLV